MNYRTNGRAAGEQQCERLLAIDYALPNCHDWPLQGLKEEGTYKDRSKYKSGQIWDQIKNIRKMKYEIFGIEIGVPHCESF